MLFRKKNSKQEYANFMDVVRNKYELLDISFEYRNYPISTENPKETPDHYGIFAYWVANKLKTTENTNILDVGNSKVGNLINSCQVSPRCTISKAIS